MRCSRTFVAAPVSAWLWCAVLVCLPLLAGCSDDSARRAAEQAEQTAARQREAIRRVFELDAALAKPRDTAMAPKNLPTAVAAMRQYAAAVGALDFTGLPEDVRSAYVRHLDAWRAAADLLDHYSGLTGTLRATIDGEAYANGRIDDAQKAVERTWEDVKAKAKAYGVDAPS